MKQNPHEEGRFSEGGHGLGTVTEAMVLKRARELALINGRTEHQVLESDIQEARRELTSTVSEPVSTPAEEIPEEDRWEAVADNSGHEVEPLPTPDEQTFAEKLVEEGLEESQHERMVEATRESRRRDCQ
jgi:hypothetical protein